MHRRESDRSRTARIATIAALAVLFVAAALLVALKSAAAPSPTSAAGPSDLHGGYTATTDSCATCHRSHSGKQTNLLETSAPQSTLCFTCHDGTGSQYDIASQYSDPNVPSNNTASSSFYSHPATAPSNHTNAQVDEFAGVLNRHSECGDCHNPHSVSPAVTSPTSAGWTVSGSQNGATGVTGSTLPTWKNPITYEYELCLKCHSGYTILRSYSKESYQKTDKAAEFDPTSAASYHPVEAPGTNTSAAMQNSLAGGNLWQFTTASTIRCTQCHGNYRLVGDPPTSNSPPKNARLSTHTSRYRGLLIANYRDRELKASSTTNDYDSNDFALCLLCHSEAPFKDGSGDPRSDTDYRFHGFHLNKLYNGSGGGPSTDIDTPAAGQGNAICAECHYRIHSTQSAYLPTDQDNPRLVNFAPNVEPLAGWQAPSWSPSGRSCTLRCHGEDHEPKTY